MLICYVEQLLRNSRYIYNEYQPDKSLCNIIEKIWTFEASEYSGSDHFNLLADYTVSIIIIQNFGKKEYDIFVTGPNLKNVPLSNHPGLKTIGLRFHPLKFRQVFGISPADTKNSAVKMRILNTVFFKQLQRKLSPKQNLLESINDIGDLFKNIKLDHLSADIIVEEFIHKIITKRGLIKLDELYLKLPFSIRKFQRDFSVCTGVTPKEFCRIVRFHNAARNLVKSNFKHLDTLYDSGFYDQSHYYREFRSLIGMLPSNFEARQKNIFHKKLT